jgi:hypothetical protein
MSGRARSSTTCERVKPTYSAPNTVIAVSAMVTWRNARCHSSAATTRPVTTATSPPLGKNAAANGMRPAAITPNTSFGLRCSWRTSA